MNYFPFVTETRILSSLILKYFELNSKYKSFNFNALKRTISKFSVI